MSAQVHSFLHHDSHIHHPSLHHPHPHRILTHNQRDHLGGWSGLLWTDYLNADAFAATRILQAELEEEIEMMEDSSEEESAEEHPDYCNCAEHNHPARALSPPLVAKAKVETATEMEKLEHRDWCPNPEHNHPPRPLSPPLVPRIQVVVHKKEQQQHEYCTIHNHPARPLSPPLLPRSKTISEEHPDYCTLHDHPARPLSPPLMPRRQSDAESEASISHYEDWIVDMAELKPAVVLHEYCTEHEHPERPLSPPLFHRSPALKGSESPSLKPTVEATGISNYEDWMDEFALDRAVADLRDLDLQQRAAAGRMLMDEANDLIDEANEIEEDMWSDAPETPTSELEQIFDEPIEDLGIAAGSYNRRSSMTEDIEEACCSCKNDQCSAASLARDLKTNGLRLHPMFGDLSKAAKVPRGAW